ncbi:MAG: DNA polymerase III subunit gamma/tau [Gammaproteobacteria bacterium]
MSYQVLARKWRPRTFSEMVGQEHVLRALINALDNDRVHHAFLFTGTRGVGKTTIARILAKSLNCEVAMSSTPCGQCSACREIDEGRFVDLLELDAASHTGIDNMREVLDNAQYAPTCGRYKVYLIDEVHMLSKPAFNSMLKTLEEPPPHVKFILATTDPQKIPVTVLSRCLQFNLKRLPWEFINKHLEHILMHEATESEPAARAAIARAADGSMRDALSLLDQAIAYGGGKLNDAEVRAMLGSIAQEHVISLLQALARNDAHAVLECIHSLAEQAVDFSGVLAELISTLHRIAYAQVLPTAVDDSLGDAEPILNLAKQIPAEDVQLFYQIGVIGRRDLPLIPDARSGFEMVLLRMLAFRPADDKTAVSVPYVKAAASALTPAPKVSSKSSVTLAMSDNVSLRASEVPVSLSESNESPAQDWASIVNALKLTAIARELAVNCEFKHRSGASVQLVLDSAHAHLRSKKVEERIEQALQQYYAAPVKLVINIDKPAQETPASTRIRQQDERQQAAIEAIMDDANIKNLRETFNASINPDSIQPAD